MPVRVNLFLAADLDLIFGISLVFKSFYDALAVFRVLFFRLGTDEHVHVASHEGRHLIGLAVIGQTFGEAKKEQLALVLVDDGTSTEINLKLDLVAVLEELDGMVALEVEVMIVGLRTQMNLLHDSLGAVGLDFLGFFLLLVEIFLIVHHLADRRCGVGRNFHKVEFVFVGEGQCLAQGYDPGFEIFAHYAHGLCGNVLVDAVLALFLGTRSRRGARLAGVRCDNQVSFLFR